MAIVSEDIRNGPSRGELVDALMFSRAIGNRHAVEFFTDNSSHTIKITKLDCVKGSSKKFTFEGYIIDFERKNQIVYGEYDSGTKNGHFKMG